MRTMLMIPLALLAGCVATHEGVRVDEATGRQDVIAASNAWIAAYNSRDPARISAMYEPDAVFWGTTSNTIRATPADVFDYFKAARNRPEARVAITDQHVRIAGDMAFSAGSYTFTNVVDGKTVSEPSRFTFVFRYRDGGWKMVHHHSSRVAPPRQ
jgi:uncharacterized protein (TIGR02246 family)